MPVTNNTSEYNDYIDEQRIAEKITQFRATVQDILEPQHDDRFLLRWLKARDFSVHKAEKMLRENIKFRKQIGADTILNRKYQYPEVFTKHMLTFRMGFDKENSVVRYWAAGPIDFKGLLRSVTARDVIKYIVYLFEGDQKAIEERRKALKQPDLSDCVSYVIDCRNFSVKRFYSKTVISLGIKLCCMYQDNYPEKLKVVYFINVPTYYKWIYNIFSPFVHQNTLKKCQFYCTDEWCDVLREVIDPEVLPAFLGGEFIHPEDDVNCSKLECRNCNIPEKYYLHNRSDRESPKFLDMKQAVVPKRSVMEIPVFVGVPGSILRWIFKTKFYTIKFGLFYKHKAKMVEILPMEEIDCQDVTEENEIICKKAGSYILCFDNSYSWLNSKQLFYKVDVDYPEVIENQN